MSSRSIKSQLSMILGGILLILLLAGVITLGSLSSNWYGELHDPQHLFLWTTTVFIMVPLAILLVVLGRTLWRLMMERRGNQAGSRFKTRMVMGAIAISLLPLLSLFFISFGLMNRTLNRWFPYSLELAQSETQTLLHETNRLEAVRLASLAKHVAVLAEAQSAGNPSAMIQTAARLAAAEGAEAVWAINAQGQVVTPGDPLSTPIVSDPALQPARPLETGGELWESRSGYFLAARAPLGPGWLLVAHRLPPDFLERTDDIERQSGAYFADERQIRTFKSQMLLTLSFFTLLLLFAASWCALYLAKQVTVPILALADATREIAAGHLDTQVHVQAQDELGALVRSFNQMTSQLSDSRRQIDDFTRNLQQAVQELDRRRTLIETVLENIPTGVVSFDANGNILRMNTAAGEIFGESGRHAATLSDLAGGATARDFQHLVRRAVRMGTASRELQFRLYGRLVHAAVTVSPLGPRSGNHGFVMVVDDLTELLRAQKVAAWQEVAQRIAHEIRNPLTPIQLSAERLARYLERHRQEPSTPELVSLVKECSALIGREVGILEAMVNEFSQFARFPVARLAPADPNEIVSGALEVFSGRLGDVAIRVDLAAALPSIKADAELMRRVIVNLIDNAAEAMEGSTVKSLELATRFLAEHDTVEICVADSGSGISPEDKDKLFLPHFSTKERGTGLGLAIASRIVAEHHGLIRAEDNRPAGARFIIELPTAEAMSAVGVPES